MVRPRAPSTIAQESSGTARLLIKSDPAELTQPRANLRTAALSRFAPSSVNGRYLRIPAVHTRREYLRGGDTASTWSGAGSTAMVSPLGMNGADWPVAVPCAGLRVDHERRSHAPPACRCDDVCVGLVV